MLTATVTAISIIEATTGLNAFLLFNIFIFFHIPPFRVSEYVVEATLLNLTTQYTILVNCRTKLQLTESKSLTSQMWKHQKANCRTTANDCACSFRGLVCRKAPARAWQLSRRTRFSGTASSAGRCVCSQLGLSLQSRSFEL